MSQSTPTKHDGRAVLFAVAELLVYGGCEKNGKQCVHRPSQSLTNY